MSAVKLDYIMKLIYNITDYVVYGKWVFMNKIDIIVPCYNEQDVLTTYYSETQKIVSHIDGCEFRYIFIDDGSRDDTLIILKGMAATYDNVRYISFSRNFGKEAGMYAGLSASDGDYVIVMDADLQHPPALIPRMVKPQRRTPHKEFFLPAVLQIQQQAYRCQNAIRCCGFQNNVA